MRPIVVGILALQGDFSLHQNSFKRIGIHTKFIRYPEELEKCEGLVLPGGESTTFINLLQKTGLFTAIQKFAETRGVMGTCAGCIALAANIHGDGIKTLNVIDINVERNAYGRQVDSFVDQIKLSIFQDKPEFEGIFIRAPKILSVGSNTEVLGYHGHEIVMARNERILVTTFHPELTKDVRIHRYFVDSFLMR